MGLKFFFIDLNFYILNNICFCTGTSDLAAAHQHKSDLGNLNSLFGFTSQIQFETFILHTGSNFVLLEQQKENMQILFRLAKRLKEVFLPTRLADSKRSLF